MTNTKVQIDIRPVPVAAIFDAPNSADLIRAYAKECLIPDAEPQRATYEAMEKVKVLQCFASYVRPTDKDILIAKANLDAALKANEGDVEFQIGMECLSETGFWQFANSVGGIAEPLLVGFISVIRAVMPHSGQLVATVESLFVDPAYRGTGAGAKLLSTAEQYAVDSGCVALTCMSRVNSAFDKVLSRREGYSLTHTQHTRWLNETERPA